jgi:hypothetical protein
VQIQPPQQSSFYTSVEIPQGFLHTFFIRRIKTMSLKGLNAFNKLDLDAFLNGKRLVFVKAVPWNEGEGDKQTIAGSKAILQIVEDKTPYFKDDISNFGEQITVKVQGTSPTAYSKLRPLATEVVITDIQKATIFGDFKNQISVIAKVKVVEAKNE